MYRRFRLEQAAQHYHEVGAHDREVKAQIALEQQEKESEKQEEVTQSPVEVSPRPAAPDYQEAEQGRDEEDEIENDRQGTVVDPHGRFLRGRQMLVQLVV